VPDIFYVPNNAPGIFFILFFFFPFMINAQWVNNPAENTKVVYDLSEPINITALSDYNGGAFILWEDNVTGLQNEISFMHIESNGNISFRADGKKISRTIGDQDNPVAVSTGKSTAVIAWKDFSVNKSGDLLMQKVNSNGSILWNQGIKINKSKMNISDYSLCANRNGEVYIAYTQGEPGQISNSGLILQKVSTSGKLLFDSLGISVSTFVNTKLNPCILTDDSSGVFVFWIETINNRGVVFSQHMDAAGKLLWGNTPLSLTDKSLDVISFTCTNFDSDIYLAYQVLRKEKNIYHQLISNNGKLLWGKNGKQCSIKAGSQSNPQIITQNGKLILSWTNEINKNKDIYIQEYDRRGKSLWHEGGIPVIEMKGDQFGQKIISDENNGVIISWMDRRTSSTMGDIYAQRITSEGKALWDTAGIAIGSFFNTPKSYLNLISDGRGSAIAVFKERRNSENGIYVQKIFNTGTFVSQIIGFNTEIRSDSVSIAWYSANELPQSNYTIERSVQTDTGNTDWEKLVSINAVSEKSANYYQYFDKPDSSGTIYYRIIQNDNLGNVQSSEVSRVTFFKTTNYIIITQNDPNPFSDSTHIKFYLPEQADVKIEFFNNHIEKIDEIDRLFPAGENSVTFMAGNKQPGIYFYKFESGDFVEVKKMVLSY
jgi:hypothetical protein